jgi:hypothetical protein
MVSDANKIFSPYINKDTKNLPVPNDCASISHRWRRQIIFRGGDAEQDADDNQLRKEGVAGYVQSLSVQLFQALHTAHSNGRHQCQTWQRPNLSEL